MTRETKVGLLIGLGVILLVGIIVSDHLSVVQHQDPAKMTTFAEQAQQSIHPDPKPRSAAMTEIDQGDARSEPATFTAADPNQPVIIDNTPTGIPREPIYTPDELDAQPVIEDIVPPLRSNPPIAGIFANADRGLPNDPADGMLDGATDPSAASSIAETGGIRAAPSDPPPVAMDGPVIEEPDTLPEPPARRPGSELIHYVKRGENLYNIAETYYGNGDYWRSIASRNPDTVGEDGRIAQGARLVIPNRSGLIDSQLVASGQFSAVASERVINITTVQPRPGAVGGKTVEVRSGDTLSGLAAKHLGDSDRWRELFDANRDQLDKPENLWAGMTLKLPAGQTQPTEQPALRRVVVRESIPTKTYTVKRGDNLTRIAERTLGDGDRWRDLFEANKHQMASADDIKVGQKLVLPR